MEAQHLRSPLSRARGLGSAREGVEHWWIQGVTAVALIPLMLWFADPMIALTVSDYNALIAWLRVPFATILMVLLLVALCHHMALGLQVAVEDYANSEWVKIPAVVAIRCACFALAVAGIIATLRIALVDEGLEPLGNANNRQSIVSLIDGACGPSSRATGWVGRVRVDSTFSPGSTAVSQLASLVLVRCCRGYGELRVN